MLIKHQWNAAMQPSESLPWQRSNVQSPQIKRNLWIIYQDYSFSVLSSFFLPAVYSSIRVQSSLTRSLNFHNAETSLCGSRVSEFEIVKWNDTFAVPLSRRENDILLWCILVSGVSSMVQKEIDFFIMSDQFSFFLKLCQSLSSVSASHWITLLHL